MLPPNILERKKSRFKRFLYLGYAGEESDWTVSKNDNRNCRVDTKN